MKRRIAEKWQCWDAVFVKGVLALAPGSFSQYRLLTPAMVACWTSLSATPRHVQLRRPCTWWRPTLETLQGRRARLGPRHNQCCCKVAATTLFRPLSVRETSPAVSTPAAEPIASAYNSYQPAFSASLGTLNPDGKWGLTCLNSVLNRYPTASSSSFSLFYAFGTRCTYLSTLPLHRDGRHDCTPRPAWVCCPQWLLAKEGRIFL